MKKSLIYILALSAIVGCQKSEVSERIPAEGESSAVIVGSLPETKTSFVDEGNVLKTEWVKDDALGFYWYKGGSIEGVGTGEVDKALNDKLIAESSGSSTTFKTHYYYMYQAGKDYLTYLYYPYNVNAGKNPLSVPFAVPSSQNQAGSDDIAHLAATDFLYATTMANRPNGEAEQTVMVTFNHALSVLNIALTSAQSNYSVSDIRVRFEDENEIFSVTEGSVNLSDGSLTLTSGTPEISLHFKEAAKLSATPVNAYMTITPGHAGKTFSVYATVNGIETKLGSKKVPASGLPTGVKAALSFEVGEMSAEHEYVDLNLPSGKLWATTNLGAITDFDFGTYYRWSSNDQATKNWGENWMTPNIEDLEELITTCSWTWETKNGINGYTVRGNNNNTIFIPAAGYNIEQNYPQLTNQNLFYWSKTPSDMSNFIFALSGDNGSVSTNIAYNTDAIFATIRPIVKNLTNGIKNIKILENDSQYSIYNINGTKLIQKQHGINLIKQNDGSYKKIVIK